MCHPDIWTVRMCVCVCVCVCDCMITAWGTEHMCGFSGGLAIWSPCVAGSEFRVERRPAALITGSLMLGVRVSMCQIPGVWVQSSLGG